MNSPEIFLIVFEIVFGLSTNFSLKKIKNNPTKHEKTAKNKTNAGVFRLTARKVPNKTPKNGIIIVNDTNEKIDDSALKNTFKRQ